jgi:hypothetical protein
MAYDGCPCFWLEATGRERVQFRRFTFSVRDGEEEADRPGHRNCPASERWGHDAGIVTDIERDTVWEDYDGSGYIVHAAVPDDLYPARDDPRWPTACAACGEPFLDDDQWQVNGLLVFTRSDTEAEHVMSTGYDPKIPGALYDGGPWMRSRKTEDGVGYVGADGIALVAVCPNGFHWEVDGPARGGGRWARTGDPRQPSTLSVTPSIVAGDYHGYLTAGAFTSG